MILNPFTFGAPPSLDLTYIGSDTPVGFVSVFNASFAAAGTGTYFVAVPTGGIAPAVSSVTVGGVSASLVTDGGQTATVTQGNNRVEVYSADLTSPANADVAVTLASGHSRLAIGVWRVVGKTVSTVVVGGGNAAPMTVTLDVAESAGDILLGVGGADGAAGWSNVGFAVERVEGVDETDFTYVLADESSADGAGSESLTCAGDFTNAAAILIRLV